MTSTLDLTPSPRVLRMLGEIDFKAWQCICEIIDNAIDSFSNMGDLAAEGWKPSIHIKIPPNKDLALEGTLEIKDNGVGMTKEALSHSLKAGFSSNNPVEKMGLFGMGFNISTARLGGRTEVITSVPNSHCWLKVTIDFQELEKQGHFAVPIEEIPKAPEELNSHGTTVRISKLRHEHIQALYQRKRICEKIGKIYGSHIRKNGITIKYSGNPCRPFKHCIWDETRNGENKGKPVPAILKIDKLIDCKRYCSTCWIWLAETDEKCPSCDQNSAIMNRERRIKGWIGIQRYFDTKHYGIDLIRNGRVITELDKSFFYWDDPVNDDEPEIEYPIDGHERKGRIVGELEIDFVKVTHQKDAFETNTYEWKEVVKHVRGDGPIRPNIAKARGYGENTSPLAQLFNAFRTAKASIKNLVPQRPNGQAMITDPKIDELKNKFLDGTVGYESDAKWWDLLVEGVHKISKDVDETLDDGSGGNPFDEAMPSDLYETEIETEEQVCEQSPEEFSSPEGVFEPDNDLSRTYSLDLFSNIHIKVVVERAFKVPHERGYKVVAKGCELFFTYWPEHDVFRRQLFQPADFLINELAYQLHSSSHNQLSSTPLTEVELALREKYFPELQPSVSEIHRQVTLFLEDATQHLKNHIERLSSLDDSMLDEQERQKISKAIAESQLLSASEIKEVFQQGRFIPYASQEVIMRVLRKHPELLYDGLFFNKKWEGVEGSLADQTLAAELNILLTDIESFRRSNQQPINTVTRGRLKRLVGSLEIVTSWRI